MVNSNNSQLFVGKTTCNTLVGSQQTSQVQLQTDHLTNETQKGFQQILNGPHSGAFCQIMDIFMSGFGGLELDTDILFVCVIYEEKNFKKNIQISMLAELEHHMMFEANQIDVIDLYIFFFTKNLMSNINAKYATY